MMDDISGAPILYRDGNLTRPTVNQRMPGNQNPMLQDNTLMPPSFRHNNMVPFIKGKQTQVMPDRYDAPSREFELFSGSGDAHNFSVNRREVEKFTDVYAQPIYGQPMPNRQKELDNVVSSTIRSNELPFQQQRVSHGLNEGFTNHGTDVLHPTWRPKPPTVDQLRSASRPKVSHAGRVVVGKSLDQREAAMGVAKHGNDRTWSNTPDKWLITGDADKKTTARSAMVMKHTSKGLGDKKQLVGFGTDGYTKGQSILQNKLKNTKRMTTSKNEINGGGHTLDSGYIISRHRARVTKKQSTMTVDYKPVSDGVEQKTIDRTMYHNAVFNALKEPTQVRRAPVDSGFAIPVGQDFVNYVSRKLNLNVANHTEDGLLNVDKSFANPPRVPKEYERDRQFYNEPLKDIQLDAPDTQLTDNRYALMIHKLA
jgi:hypothetical protein